MRPYAAPDDHPRLVAALILSASIAAGVDDDAGHRRASSTAQNLANVAKEMVRKVIDLRYR